MKLRETIFMLLLSFLAPLFAIDIPHEMRELIADPPSISKPTNRERVAFTFEGKSAIVEGDDFYSFIEFTNELNDRAATYRFRTYSKRFDLEISGEGEVVENYYRVTDLLSGSGDAEVIDRGSRLEIDAGIFKVEWSAGNHIYLGKSFTAIAATEDDYIARTKR